jgi:hypothetical protein
MAELTPAPPGFAYLKNRGTGPYEEMFDGRVYAFTPGEVKLLPEEAATFLKSFSLVQVDLERNTGERVLVTQDDPKWEESLDTSEYIELVDRSYGDNPAGGGTGGIKTHAAVIPVRGGKRLTRAAVPS